MAGVSSKSFPSSSEALWCMVASNKTGATSFIPLFEWPDDRDCDTHWPWPCDHRVKKKLELVITLRCRSLICVDQMMKLRRFVAIQLLQHVTFTSPRYASLTSHVPRMPCNMNRGCKWSKGRFMIISYICCQFCCRVRSWYGSEWGTNLRSLHLPQLDIGSGEEDGVSADGLEGCHWLELVLRSSSSFGPLWFVHWLDALDKKIRSLWSIVHTLLASSLTHVVLITVFMTCIASLPVPGRCLMKTIAQAFRLYSIVLTVSYHEIVSASSNPATDDFMHHRTPLLDQSLNLLRIKDDSPKWHSCHSLIPVL